MGGRDPRRLQAYVGQVLIVISQVAMPTSAAAVSGPLPSSIARSASVVAVGTLPVSCGQPFLAICSGVVVAPQLVLTAAHCLPTLRAVQRAQVLYDTGSARGIVGVSSVHVHPAYYATEAENSDVAILVLSKPIGVPAARLPSQTLDSSWVGTTGTIQGFGALSPKGRTQATSIAGTAIVTSLDDEVIKVGPSPNMLCDGDSGGAFFLREAEEEEVFGLLVQSDAACANWGSAVRLDTGARTFVDEALGKPAPGTMSTRATFDQLCTSSCLTDGDCPEERVCFGSNEASGRAGRCVPAGLPPGDEGGPCDDPTCDACVQIDGREFDCRCYRLCEAPRPQQMASAAPGGCTIGQTAWLQFEVVNPFLICAWLLAERRRRKG